jgi:hypothetical protein
LLKILADRSVVPMAVEFIAVDKDKAGAEACPPSPPAAAPDLADLARRVHELAEHLDAFLRAAGAGRLPAEAKE